MNKKGYSQVLNVTLFPVKLFNVISSIDTNLSLFPVFHSIWIIQIFGNLTFQM